MYIAAPDRAPVGSFYFVENGEGSFAETAQAIPQSWSVEEATEE
jgi:hypothetical protein